MSNKILLQHTSYGGHNMEILQSGFLRPSSKTGISALYGDLSDWSFVRIDTGLHKGETISNFYIDPLCLLKTKFILHTGWEGDVQKGDIIIDGTKLTKYKLLKLLENFKQRARLRVELIQLLYGRNRLRSDAINSNEILIKNDIDLHKYLVEFRGYNDEEDQYYLEHYVNNKRKKKQNQINMSPVKSKTRKTRKTRKSKSIIYAETG